jgi:hypothetical protein
MNEQIKECWLKAAREDSSETWDTQVQFIERFAGLIVLECIDVFGRDLPEPGGDGKMMEVVNRICNVAEHFGVGDER